MPKLTEITNAVFKYRLVLIPATIEIRITMKYRLSSLTDQLIFSVWLSWVKEILPSFMIFNNSVLSIKAPDCAEDLNVEKVIAFSDIKVLAL